MDTGLDDRREFQRLELRDPIPGEIDSAPARIVNLGVMGARVELGGPIAEAADATLRFQIDGHELAFECVIAHLIRASVMSSAPFEAGLIFSRALDESDDKLRRVLAKLFSDEIALHRPDELLGATTPNFDADGTAMRIPAPFIAYRFDNGSWRRRGVFIPDQPESGFTVPSSTDREELDRLCVTYELSDAEGRRLIRLFAELHVCRVLGVPRSSEAPAMDS